jgi:hypothetical protein
LSRRTVNELASRLPEAKKNLRDAVLYLLFCHANPFPNIKGSLICKISYLYLTNLKHTIMLVKTFGSAVFGINAATITIEADVTKGIKFLLVGLPDNAVKESQ